MPVTDLDSLTAFVQQHFTDGLVLVVGSGLSAAEGIPGMPALAEHLKLGSDELDGPPAAEWSKIAECLDAHEGLEAALLKHPPGEQLKAWVVRKTCDLLMPREREVIATVIKKERVLRITKLLAKILKPPNGLPVLTPNYDRLVEVGCEMAGLHVDTTAIGQYAGAFDHTRSCMASCRKVVTRGRVSMLEHFPRAIVLKPHGSLDWYRSGTSAVRSAIELEAERLIITPGLNKYRAGYNFPFDKHRELANNYIDRSTHLLTVGYGFNDDHLQVHLDTHIRDGTPTLIMARTASDKAKALAQESPSCVCLAMPSTGSGVTVVTKNVAFEEMGKDIWDLGILVEELLS